VGRVDSAERRLLLEGEAYAMFAAPGYLLYVARSGVMARRFNPVSLEFEGVAQPLVQAEFLRNELGGQPAFSASGTGVLTYAIVEKPRTQFQWFGRDGIPQQLVGQPAVYYTFDLSDDGQRLVYGRIEAGSSHLRVLELDGEVTSAITSGTGFYADPRWAAGPSVVATRWQPLPPAIVRIAADGTESVIASARAATMLDDVGGDGDLLLYRDPTGQLLAASVFDTTDPIRVRTAPSGRINQGRLSPDGRWVAYQESDLKGRYDVYVASFPPTGQRWQVSLAGAVQPMWRADSRELYFLALDGTLTAVTVRQHTHRPFSSPTPLFTTGLLPPAPTIEEYAVGNGGQRFLLLRPIEDRVRSSIGVIANWTSLLREPVTAR
jgi:hypothetical protein